MQNDAMIGWIHPRKHRLLSAPVLLVTSLIWPMLGTTAASSDTAYPAASFSDSPMNTETARAMLERFGYGATLDDIEHLNTTTPRAYLERGIHAGSTLPPLVQQRIAALEIAKPADVLWTEWGPGGEQIALKDMATDTNRQMRFQQATLPLLRETIEARMLTLANSDNPAHEVLLSFWLNHFSIFGQKHFDRLVAKNYADNIEAAMREDSFETLLRASFYSPAMQLYLDNAQSTAPDSAAAQFAQRKGKKIGINENLARELLELHTLGVDAGYSQKDVQELARIITGAGVWSPKMRDRALEKAGAERKGLFLFDPRRHDFGEKQLLGQKYPKGHGLDEIDAALHQLAQNPFTAKHLSRKLALRFVSDNPSPALIEAMTKAWLDSRGRISTVLLTMIDSHEFHDSLTARAKFKEPIDYIVSVARASCQNQSINNGALLTMLAYDSGEAPFLHSTPDGYPTRENDWLSPAAMAKRIRLAMGVAAQKLPLRDGPPSSDIKNHTIKAAMANDDSQQKKPWEVGTACAIDPMQIEKTIGPLSTKTQQALAGLSPIERSAALLAAPEFLHR